MSPPPAVLVTGASSGIGAIYADRFARRGHDLVLVARHRERLEAVAARVRDETGVGVETMVADLADPAHLARVEARLGDDARIGVLVNNAGIALGGDFASQDADSVAELVTINSLAVIRLAHAAAHRFVAEGAGTIITIGSVVGLMPEGGQAAYAASKAFVQVLSQALHHELAPRGVRVQLVLPAATRTGIWDVADPARVPPMMEPEALVDAALAGLDRGEAVTVPPLQDEALWDALEAARHALLPEFGHTEPGPRYRRAA